MRKRAIEIFNEKEEVRIQTVCLLPHNVFLPFCDKSNLSNYICVRKNFQYLWFWIINSEFHEKGAGERQKKKKGGNGEKTEREKRGGKKERKKEKKKKRFIKKPLYKRVIPFIFPFRNNDVAVSLTSLTFDWKQSQINSVSFFLK